MGRSPGSHMLAPTTAPKSGAGVQPKGVWASRTKISTAEATMIPTTSSCSWAVDRPHRYSENELTYLGLGCDSSG